MKLNAKLVEQSKANGKLQKLSDGGGLYLEITAKGNRRWRYRYYYENREQLISLGTYPEISLKEARERHFEARKQVANGINPSQARQAEKEAQAGTGSFESIAREWHTKHAHKWTDEYREKLLVRLEKNIFPWLGKKPLNKITPPELLTVVRRMEDRGALETAHRQLSVCGQIFRYAIATGRAKRDITQDLRGALPPTKKTHLASITDPKEVGALLRAIDGYEGTFVVKCALQLAPLTFVRPANLREAEWSEFDFANKEWHIPAHKMKAAEKHIVPLSEQALAVLEAIRPLTGHGSAAKYVFPSVRTMSRPMSNNAVLSALRRMGYEKHEMSGHGFRHMASTLLNEQGWNRDAIERQLAHAERDNVRATYNYAQYLPERHKMMQAWADYLEGLKNGK